MPSSNDHRNNALNGKSEASRPFQYRPLQKLQPIAPKPPSVSFSSTSKPSPISLKNSSSKAHSLRASSGIHTSTKPHLKSKGAAFSKAKDKSSHDLAASSLAVATAVAAKPPLHATKQQQQKTLPKSSTTKTTPVNTARLNSSPLTTIHDRTRNAPDMTQQNPPKQTADPIIKPENNPTPVVIAKKVNNNLNNAPNTFANDTIKTNSAINEAGSSNVVKAMSSSNETATDTRKASTGSNQKKHLKQNEALKLASSTNSTDIKSEPQSVDADLSTNQNTTTPTSSKSVSTPTTIDVQDNPDYIALTSALSLLQMQLQIAQNDIVTLRNLKMDAMSNPEQFLLHLKSNTNPNATSTNDTSRGLKSMIPSMQRIVKIPLISWDKYGIDNSSLDAQIKKGVVDRLDDYDNENNGALFSQVRLFDAHQG